MFFKRKQEDILLVKALVFSHKNIFRHKSDKGFHYYDSCTEQKQNIIGF